MGDWKLIENYEFGDLELYNLKDDPQEKMNLYDKYPEKVKELTLLLDSIKSGYKK